MPTEPDFKYDPKNIEFTINGQPVTGMDKGYFDSSGLFHFRCNAVPIPIKTKEIANRLCKIETALIKLHQSKPTIKIVKIQHSQN